jgi:glycine hydroxymethyltransferase
MSQIAAKAVCFELASRAPFRETQRRTRRLAAALAAELALRGDRIVTGGTDTHMVLVDLRGRGITGDLAEAALERIGILTNRNLIPFDPEPPARTSGLRIGTPGAAVRGMDASEAPELATLIDDALRPGTDERTLLSRLDATLDRFPLRG